MEVPFWVAVAPFVMDALLLPVAVCEPEPVFEPVSLGEGEGVSVAADVELFSESFLTIKESSSGNHRGQGHAATNVERYNKNIV